MSHGEDEARNHPQRRREDQVVHDRRGAPDRRTEDDHARRQARVHQDVEKQAMRLLIDVHHEESIRRQKGKERHEQKEEDRYGPE